MIDWERVADLRSEVGEDDFREVIALFLEEVEGVIDRLKANPDPACYEQDLHFLKGSALNLGFRAFSALCQTGEKLAAAGQAHLIDITAVIHGYEHSRDQFLQDLPRQHHAA